MNFRGRIFQLFIILPILLPLFIVSCSLAEVPSPPSDPYVCDRTPIRSLSFANENTGWAVGECGTVLKTEDGGETWHLQESQSTADLKSAHAELRSVFFINEQIGWAAGWSIRWNGYIVKTVDGGTNWQLQYSGNTLNDIHFVDELHGWASGGHGTVLRTVDGGQTWGKLTSLSVQYDIQSIYFLDENKGWTVGYGDTLLTTDDGGDHWQRIATFLNLQGGYEHVEFVDYQTGFIFGSRYDPPGNRKSGKGFHSVLKTSDGGQSWDEFIITRWEGIYDGSSYAYGINAATFINTEIGWAVGHNPMLTGESAVFETTDGGETWQQIRKYSGIELTAIYALNSERILVAGGEVTPEFSRTSVILDVKEGIQLYP